jgi:hypothetical protein
VRLPATSPTSWAGTPWQCSYGGPLDRWKLSEPVASQLGVVREKLDKWWNSDALTISERNYLIDHRADRELPPHTVMVEPPVIRTYLEMKMREAPVVMT